MAASRPIFMKLIARAEGFRKLRAIRSRFAEHINAAYEPRAKNCGTCETKGACCLDAHFVNVHVTKLEAAAIVEVLNELPDERRGRIEMRIAETISRYGLADTGDTFSQTYACPLFEPLAGCVVHGKAKPLPCIHHACYENENDLPPDELLDEAAAQVEKLNRRVYGERPVRWLPLPIAVKAEQG